MPHDLTTFYVYCDRSTLSLLQRISGCILSETHAVFSEHSLSEKIYPRTGGGLGGGGGELPMVLSQLIFGFKTQQLGVVDWQIAEGMAGEGVFRMSFHWKGQNV